MNTKPEKNQHDLKSYHNRIFGSAGALMISILFIPLLRKYHFAECCRIACRKFKRKDMIPMKKSKLPIVISVLAAVAVAGGSTAVFAAEPSAVPETSSSISSQQKTANDQSDKQTQTENSSNKAKNTEKSTDSDNSGSSTKRTKRMKKPGRTAGTSDSASQSGESAQKTRPAMPGTSDSNSQSNTKNKSGFRKGRMKKGMKKAENSADGTTKQRREKPAAGEGSQKEGVKDNTAQSSTDATA